MVGLLIGKQEPVMIRKRCQLLKPGWQVMHLGVLRRRGVCGEGTFSLCISIILMIMVKNLKLAEFN